MADRGGQGQILALRLVICRCWLSTLAGSFRAFAALAVFAFVVACTLGTNLACTWGAHLALGDGVPGYAAPVARVDAVGFGASERATDPVPDCSVALSTIVQLAYLMRSVLLACDGPWLCGSGND